MRTAFVVFPPCGSIALSVARGLKAHGISPHLFQYGAVSHPSQAWRAATGVLDPQRRGEIRASFNQVIREAILPALELERPDIVLFLKGDVLDRDVHEALSSAGIRIVCWAYDSLSRCPEQLSAMDLASRVFVMDGADVATVAGHAEWLPLGFDAGFYYPSDTGHKDIDVLLVGSLMRLYKRRRSFLHRLGASALARHRRCVLVGSTGTRFGDAMLRVPETIEWASPRLPEADLARLVSRAKICVNILQDDGKQPVNPLFFGIPGAKVCEAAEAAPHLSRWLTPGVQYLAVDETTFIDRFEELLEDEEQRETIAAAGFAEARRAHTYDERLRTILRSLAQEVST